MADVGIDTSKEWIDVSVDSGNPKRVERETEALDRAMAELPAGSRIVLEATGRYHRLVVERAQLAGHQVKVVDPYAFSMYMKSLNPRGTNDKLAAKALSRFAAKEWDRLRDYYAVPKKLQRLRDLLTLRQAQVEARVALDQAMSEIDKMPASSKAIITCIERAIKDLDLKIFALVHNDPLYEEFLRMDGVGPQTAPALVWLFRAFQFKTSDQVVAFVGLDIRVRQSGKYEGQRKLTKRGPSFIRRLLGNGAISLFRMKHYKPLFAKLAARGFKPSGIRVQLSRRMLRAAFALAVHGARFDRAKFYAP
jgi:transposase